MHTNAAIIGVGQSAYTRRPQPGQSTHTFIRDAVVAALKDAEIDPREVDGMAVASFSLAPDAAVDLAWKLGLSLRWLVQDTNGGSSAMNMLGHALRAVETGAASVILVTGGDATGLGGYAKVAANFNTVTQLHLAPLGHGGPNGVYALVTSRQMKTYGLQKSDYGHLAIAQRAWAANNPYAVYRAPMTMEDYLAAPLVADPLSRYDCVPVVAGAQAIVIARPDRCPRGRASVRVRAHRASFNYDNQEGDGLQTGISTFAGELWRAAGVGPEDIDVASIYDDYPTMVLAQLNDLGMIPGGDLARFARRDIGERRFPLNTWGGMLSAGQPGGPAGGLNGISEAVLQLQHRAGARQVEGARLAVTTGYGMTMYRYGGTAAAAVLERAE
jgi:acetyl-CoA acetyltransferase